MPVILRRGRRRPCARIKYGWNGDWIIDGTSPIVDDKWLLQAGATITRGAGPPRVPPLGS
jgi:hypothetical protein